MSGETRERNRRANEIFQDVMDLPVEERFRAAVAACGSDPALRERVLRLIEADLDPDETPVLGDGLRDLLQEVLDDAERREREDRALASPEIPGFEFVREIGRGGMGAVFEMKQLHPSRRVAVKVIRPRHFGSRAREQFRRETDLLGGLRHPGIVPVFEAGTEETPQGPRPWFAMEFVEGRSLLEWVRSANPDRRLRLRVFVEICHAVQHAHHQGIVHRDLKPENILIEDGSPRPRVLDFGIASAEGVDERAGTSGTPSHMSPEQCAGGDAPVGPGTDIYSLGVILHELLVGELPERDEETRELVSPPSRFDRTCRGDLDAIVARALARDPGDRYASARDLREDVERHLDLRPVRARPAGAVYRTARFLRRHRALAAAVLAIMAVLLAGVVVSVAAARREARQRDRADHNADRANLVAAELSLRYDDAAGAEARLELIPEERRGWEHDHLTGRLDRSLAVLEIPHMHAERVAVSERGRIALRRGLRYRSKRQIVRVLSDGREGRELFRREVEKDGSIALSRDGRLLAFGVEAEGAPRLEVFDLEEGGDAPLAVIRNAGEVYSLVFHPRRPLLLAGGDGTLRIWDLDRAAPGRDLEPRTVERASGAFIRDLDFNRDASLLATAGDTDRTVRIWRCADLFADEFEEPEPVLVLRGHGFHVVAAAFSPVSNLLASGDIRGVVRLWDVDGSLAAAGGPEGPQRTGIQVDAKYTRGDGVEAVAWSPNGRRLYAGTQDGPILVWAVEEDWRVRDRADYEKVYRIPRREPLEPFRGHRKTVFSLAVTSAGLLVSAGWDETIRVWCPIVTDVPELDRHFSSVMEARFGPTGRHVATAGAAGNLVIRRTDSLSIVGQRSFDRGIRGLDWQGDWLVAATSGESYAYGFGGTFVMDASDFAAGLPVRKLLPPDGEIRESTAVVLSARGSRLAVADRSGKIDVWRLDRRGHEHVRTVRWEDAEPGETSVSSLRFLDPDGRLLAASFGRKIPFDTPGAIGVFDLERGMLVETHPVEIGTVLALGVNPDRSRLVAGTGMGTLEVFSVRPGRTPVLDHRRTLQAHPQPLQAVAFDPHGRRLATGSVDRTIKLWDTSRWAETVTLNGHIGHVNTLDFAPDGRRLVSGSSGFKGKGIVAHLWEIPPGDGSARARAERILDRAVGRSAANLAWRRLLLRAPLPLDEFRRGLLEADLGRELAYRDPAFLARVRERLPDAARQAWSCGVILDATARWGLAAADPKADRIRAAAGSIQAVLAAAPWRREASCASRLAGAPARDFRRDLLLHLADLDPAAAERIRGRDLARGIVLTAREEDGSPAEPPVPGLRRAGSLAGAGLARTPLRPVAVTVFRASIGSSDLSIARIPPGRGPAREWLRREAYRHRHPGREPFADFGRARLGREEATTLALPADEKTAILLLAGPENAEGSFSATLVLRGDERERADARSRMLAALADLDTEPRDTPGPEDHEDAIFGFRIPRSAFESVSPGDGFLVLDIRSLPEGAAVLGLLRDPPADILDPSRLRAEIEAAGEEVREARETTCSGRPAVRLLSRQRDGEGWLEKGRLLVQDRGAIWTLSVLARPRAADAPGALAALCAVLDAFEVE